MPIDVQTRATEGLGATNLNRILTNEELDTNFITLKQSSNILYENIKLSANNVKDALDEVKQEIDDLDFTASNIEYEFAPTFAFDNVETALNMLFDDREIQNVTTEDDPTDLFYPTMEDKKEGQSDLISVVDDFYYVPAQKRLYVNTLNGNVIGNASTATTLQTQRQINGTFFDGSSNIITSNWGTARNVTIGATTKAVNGSENVSWSLQEIGVTAENTAFNDTTINLSVNNVQEAIDTVFSTVNSTITNEISQVNQTIDDLTDFFTFQVNTNAWIQNAGNEYVATISVQGILSTDRPLVDIDLSAVPFNDVPDFIADWSNVYRVEASADNQIKLYALDLPENNIQVLVKIVR